MFESALAIILVLGALIFFHELGHFLVARLFGIGVSVFSLGFGPKLFSFVFGKTEYRLSAIPLGGYVSLVGEAEDDNLPDKFTPQESFAKRPPWQRILVVAAGPVFNFVLAWFIYWGLFWAHGQMELIAEIGQVAEESPAYQAGLQPGDKVVSVNGNEVVYWDDMVMYIQESRGEPLQIEIQRNSTVLAFSLVPEIVTRQNIFGEDIQTPQVGVIASGETVSIPLSMFSAAGQGAAQTWMLMKLTVQGIIKLIERIIPLDTIGGPIMIAQLVSEQTHEGLVNLLALTALISINLGLINLLPIPVLDGGHIVFYTAEMITGKPLNERMKQMATRVGISLLLALMALAIFNDLWRIFR
ncbi:RIP metalloprotease RseP [Desulfonatronovibrio hydrogenovorans]|uniref:RIP metalloprotease RseP n=1 Tax=Desulfonatronovibrio hydrogenovorans TaxID=53245 RepID=UPI00048BDA8C|nr:RIP metalloprotease RseP [Desulfonatronovibrio hydrogenovorans]